MPRQFHLDPNVQALEAQLKTQIEELKAFSAMNVVKKSFHNSNAQEVEEQAERTMRHLLHEVIMCSIKESDVTGRTSEENDRLSQFSKQPEEVSRSSADDRDCVRMIEAVVHHGPLSHRSRAIIQVTRLAARDHKKLRQHFVSSQTLAVLVVCLKVPTLTDCALDALHALADALGFANRDTVRDLVSSLTLLLRNGSTHAKVSASVVLCKMASNDSVRQIVLDSEAPRFLLNLASQATPAERENALQALFHLAPDIQCNLIDPVFLTRFVELLGHTDARHKKETAACAGIISVLADNPNHHEDLENTNVIAPLKRLIEWNDNETAQIHALSALFKLANASWLRIVIADRALLQVLVQHVYHLDRTVRQLAGALMLRLARSDQSRARFLFITRELISLIESGAHEHRETALRILEQAACDQNIACKISSDSRAMRQLFALLATNENAVAFRGYAANILLALVRAEASDSDDQITSHAMPSLLEMAASTDPDERGTALEIVLRLTRSANARNKLNGDADWITTLQEIQRTGAETHRHSATEVLRRLGPAFRARSSLLFVAGEKNDLLPEMKLSWRDVLCGCFSHRSAKSRAARDKDEEGGSISGMSQISATPTSAFSHL
ncbi:hypothetical protein PINS_up005527 [Pythium insidiosum]|nr:hypothetical protein PINS_up005527 [Pythium insidiosum]